MSGIFTAIYARGRVFAGPTADGTSGQAIVTDASGNLSFATVSGATPAGSGTELQYRNSTALGAVSNSSFAAGLLTLPKIAVVGNDDATQFSVTGYSSQTNANPLVRLKKSDGTDLIWLHADHNTNLFLGKDSGTANIADPVGGNPGTANTFVGYQTGQFNTVGKYNTALGTHALNANTTGEFNTALGPNSLLVNTTGGGNLGIGHGALFSNISGAASLAIGVDSLKYNTVGYAFAIGYNSQRLTTTGEYNLSLGYNSLSANTTGGHNIVAGLGAGTTNVTGSYNILLGVNANVSTSSTSAAIAIGDSAVASSNQCVIGSTTAPTNTLKLITDGSGGSLTLGVTSGNLTLTPTGGNIGINVAPSAYGAGIQGLTISASGSPFLDYKVGSARIALAYSDGTDFIHLTDSNWPMALYVSAALRVRYPVAAGTANQYYNSTNYLSTTVASNGDTSLAITTATSTSGFALSNPLAVTGKISGTAGISAGPIAFATLNAMTATATLGVYRITDRGNKLAYPDGTNWRFVGDDAIIS